jgi:hypothetical protein
MALVRQKFPEPPPADIEGSLRRGLPTLGIKTGARIAVGVGSRGITNLVRVVSATVALLKEAGARPFLFPAMGSHGGATPEGQRGVLEDYGVTEASCGAPVRPSLDTRVLGTSDDGVPAHCSVEALDSDGILLVNRVKPHTDFQGTLGSGVIKMTVIGLGKQAGASACHRASSRLGHERVLRGVFRILVRKAPVLGGVALVEDARHRTARVEVIPAVELEARETVLLDEARRLMARLPFEKVDLLVVDRIGKDVSGAGMDPNVTGRTVHGYSSRLSDPAPVVRRILVRDLTPASHGNAIGIGTADFATARLVNKIDRESTYMNALTALSIQSIKIPPYFETDREAVAQAVASLAYADVATARVVRIVDTLTLETVEASEALAAEARGRQDLEVLREPGLWKFDSTGVLLPLGA